MDNNKQREQMMDAALAFILSYGRDVQEAAVRKHLKAAFPMPNEREQSVWIMSTFSNLEELRAIRRTGSMVGITQRGRRIVKRGGVSRYELWDMWRGRVSLIAKGVSILIAAIGIWATAIGPERSWLQILFAVASLLIAAVSIYSLSVFLRLNRKRRDK